jgi:5-bromo-4-chloroindolyl phosphate hydrolysis protein
MVVLGWVVAGATCSCSAAVVVVVLALLLLLFVLSFSIIASIFYRLQVSRVRYYIEKGR